MSQTQLRKQNAALVLLISQLGLATSQTQTLCSAYWHRHAIVQNVLYFFSGQYTFEGDTAREQRKLFSLNLTIGLDLSGPFTSDILEHDLPGEVLYNANDSAALFYDHTGFYAYNALPLEKTNNTIWAYNASATTHWTSKSVKGRTTIPDDLLAGQDASSGNGMSFYLGGDVDENWVNGSIGLTIFNSTNPNAPFWQFNSVGPGSRPPGIQDGELVYLRKGEAGVLLAFGGLNTTGVEDDYGNLHSRSSPRNFSDISIYDIASETWYTQEATGADEVPGPLREFCAGVSAAPDDSSFQITVYGGKRFSDFSASNSVWILSVPSFRWIPAEMTGDPDGRNGAFGRLGSRCDMLHDRQMIVSGGKVMDNTQQGDGEEGYWANQECNTTFPLIKLLDTTELAWRPRIDPFTEYSVPTIVYSVIGGNEFGGASLMQPQNGWSDSKLKDIFSRTLARDAPSVSQSPSGTPTPEPTSASRLPVGAIVGGAIGGVAFIGLLGIVTYCLWKRRRKVKRLQVPIQHPHIPKEYLEIDGTNTLNGSNLVSEVHGNDHRAELGVTRLQPPTAVELPTAHNDR